MTDSQNKGLQLLPATEEHIGYLLNLQQAFQKLVPTEKKEFAIAYEVSSDPFSREDFQNIVSRNECVILADGEVPVGYMLADSCSETSGRLQFTEAIHQLIDEEMLDPLSQQMPRFIEVLNPQLYEKQFDEVRWQMLLTLIYINKEKYKGFYYTFFTNSNTLFEKLNTGWKIAFENGLYYFMVWDFNELETLKSSS